MNNGLSIKVTVNRMPGSTGGRPVGTDKNGNESGERMVSGRNTILRRSGIYPGENTRLNLKGKQKKSKQTICDQKEKIARIRA